MAVAGLECEFIEKPPKAFQFECPICLLVLREPYQATCCGKSFCKECIHRIKDANEACPTCKDRNFNLFHNKGLQQSLYDYTVYCTHKSKGCEWTGELRELDSHLNSDPPADKLVEGCSFTLIKCPLGCAYCVKGLLRKNCKIHISDNIDKLLSFVVGQAALMKSIEQQNTQLKTRLANIEENEKRHEQLIEELIAKVSRLEREAGLKKGELENDVKMKKSDLVSKSQPGQPLSDTHQITGTYRPTGAEITMTDFEECRKDNESWYSPHFYTHPKGYKMCLRVYANGLGDGEGTHLSLYVYLMRGEFDDQLKWPLRGAVTIQLVNQEEDKDHVMRTAHFDEGSSAETNNRVLKRGRATKAPGIRKFVSQSDLYPKFLNDDCIKLRIKKVKLY